MTANGGGTTAKELEAPHRRTGTLSVRARIADRVVISFWRSGSWLLGHLPARPSIAVAGWLMFAAYYLVPPKRDGVRSNMAHVLGVPFNDPRAGRLTRSAYRHYGRYIVELMRLPWLPRERCERMLEVEGMDQIRRVVAESTGVVMVGGHIANNEAAAAGFASNGLPITVVGDDSAFGSLYDLLEQQRNSWGLQMVGWRNLRGCFKVLAKHEILALLIDWGYRKEDIPVKLFGRWTTLPAGPAYLAARHHSAILPFSVERLPDGRYRGMPDRPIFAASNSPADLQRATQEVADALERAIARAPEQWYIFKPIWPATEAEERELEARAAAMLAGKSGAVVAPGPQGSPAPDAPGAADVQAKRPGDAPAHGAGEVAPG